VDRDEARERNIACSRQRVLLQRTATHCNIACSRECRLLRVPSISSALLALVSAIYIECHLYRVPSISPSLLPSIAIDCHVYGLLCIILCNTIILYCNIVELQNTQSVIMRI